MKIIAKKGGLGSGIGLQLRLKIFNVYSGDSMDSVETTTNKNRNIYRNRDADRDKDVYRDMDSYREEVKIGIGERMGLEIVIMIGTGIGIGVEKM
jgi:hypothetical protein